MTTSKPDGNLSIAFHAGSQAEAELVKDTRTWPGYSVYRQLEPQPVATVLTGDLEPVARKFARGLQFYGRELGAFLHLPQLVAGILVLLWVLLDSLTRRWPPPEPGSAAGPVAMAVGTLGLLCVLTPRKTPDDIGVDASVVARLMSEVVLLAVLTPDFGIGSHHSRHVLGLSV